RASPHTEHSRRLNELREDCENSRPAAKLPLPLEVLKRKKDCRQSPHVGRVPLRGPAGRSCGELPIGASR
ncbi:MAG: hypothetical protein ACK5SX_02290, partial [Sandaracinobacter sp.]